MAAPMGSPQKSTVIRQKAQGGMKISSDTALPSVVTQSSIVKGATNKGSLGTDGFSRNYHTPSARPVKGAQNA